MAKRFERAGRTLGTEFDRAVRLLEKEAAVAARKGKKMQQAARKRSVRLLRRASRILNNLAAGLEKQEAGRRRTSTPRRGRA